MSNNSFTRFQKRNGDYKKAAQSKLNTHFIFQGYPSIEIKPTNIHLDEDGNPVEKPLQACVVHQDDKDAGYIYTQLSNELQVGSVWAAKNLHMLVDHEVAIIKDVNWHKYHYLSCNVECDDWWGYFIGPEKSHIDVEVHKQVAMTSKQKPILVAAGHPLDFADKIMIGGRGWIVDEFDAISTPGVTYYSLMPTTMSKKEEDEGEEKKEVYVEKKEEKTYQLESSDNNLLDEHVIKGQSVEITTEKGYFKTSAQLNIKKHTATSVTFEVPYGIDEFDVEIKKKGAIVLVHYCVIG